tara:strand:+ start:847 stop:1155 length:309 start_codon:yes stop_codon:yes gene_type:complete
MREQVIPYIANATRHTEEHVDAAVGSLTEGRLPFNTFRGMNLLDRFLDAEGIGRLMPEGEGRFSAQVQFGEGQQVTVYIGDLYARIFRHAYGKKFGIKPIKQ